MVMLSDLNTGPVPALRGELDIRFRGDRGSRKALIYDPVAHRYYELSHASTVLLQFWSLRDPEKIKQALAQIGETFSAGKIDSLSKFLVENALAKHPGAEQGFELWHKRNALMRSMKVRFSSLVFFRVPLGSPDRTLTWLYALVWPLLTRGFAWLTGIAFLIACWLLIQMPDAATTHARQLISLQGAPLFLLAIALVKLGHELGHGLQAKKLGLNVPSGGIMFLLGLPLPYVELSSAWTLEDGRDRLKVDAGGLLAEAAIASWCLLAFCFWPDGTTRSILLAMATTSLVLSLIVNLNPLMRFDGYFMLSDALGVKNLQNRSIALMKWTLRELLFDLREDAPEPWQKHKRRGLVAYATALVIYRLFLHIGIALLAYTVLNKAFGIAVFTLQLLFFVVLPVVQETKVWWTKRETIVSRPRSYVSAIFLAGLIALFLIPMPQRITVPARLSTAEKTTLFAPDRGIVTMTAARNGTGTDASTVLWQFKSPQTSFDIERTTFEIAALDERITRLAAQRTARSDASVLTSERARLVAKLEALEETARSYEVTAGSQGIVYAHQFGLGGLEHAPFAITPETELGHVFSSRAPKVTAQVPDWAITRLPDSVTGLFKFGLDAALLSLPRKVPLDDVVIRNTPTAQLTHPEMSDVYGGPILTDPQDPSIPQNTWFELTASAADDVAMAHPGTISGQVILDGIRTSYATRIWDRVAFVLVNNLDN